MEVPYDNVIQFPRKYGMNLEKTEERCLNYLRQASNPLVPVQTLVEFCRRDPECGKLELKELVDFLRPHELVHVVDGPKDDEEVDVEIFEEAGIIMGPRVILKSRIPSRDQMADMLSSQVQNMTSVLVEALELAKKKGDAAHIAELEAALIKSEELRGKMNSLL